MLKIGQILIPTVLVAALATAPAPTIAWQGGNGTSQTDAKAREQAEQYLDQAGKELKKNQFQAARELVSRAKAADASAPGIEEMQVKINAAEKEFQAEAKEEQIDKLLESSERKLRANQFDAARQDVTAALEIDAQNRDAQKLRTKIQEEEQEFREKQLEDRVEKHIDAAEDAVDDGNFERARQQLAAAREAAQGLFQDDLADLQADIEKEESKARAREMKDQLDRLENSAKNQIKANQYEAARQSVNEMLRIDRNSNDAKKLMAKIEKGEREFAEERRERELEAALTNAERYSKANRHEQAAEAYMAALEIDPQNSDAKKGLAASKKAMGASEEKAAAQAKTRAARETAPKETPKTSPANPEMVTKAPEEKAPVASEKPQAVRQVSRQDTKPANMTEPDSETAPAQMDEPAAERPVRARPTPLPADPNLPQFNEKVSMGDTALAEDRPRDAMVHYREAAELIPAKADELKSKMERAERLQEQQEKAQSKERRAAAERAFEEGVTLYNQGQLDRARQRWLDAKELDPSFTKADVYLEDTEDEYNEYLANRASREDFERREAAALDKLETLIPIRTLEPTPLAEFLQTLRLLSGIDFVIAGEVTAKVEAAFEDEPLNQVLDSVLLPIGLRWEREPGSDTIVISPDLRTEVFTVLPQQLNVVEALLEEGVIQRLLWGPTGQPTMRGQEIFTDERQNIVILTDSEQNLTKFRRFIEGPIKDSGGVDLIFDSYQIDETKAPQIKALLDAILSVDDEQPYNTQRKLILEGDTLIIKDTPENVAKVRQILQDNNFLEKFYTNELTVATFNLTPIINFEDNPDLVRAFADQVRQVVETLLYAREGRSAAERDGRRLWYDPATLQLTITDTPDRLEVVQDYIESLPQLRSRRRSKIIFLEWASADDLVGQIESFLGISASATDTSNAGNEITKTMRVEDELEYRGATFRVTRVEENDAVDENDDSVELIVRTGTASQDITIEEFRSEFVEDFEIVAEDIDPSNTPGEGRARLTIRFVDQDAGDDDLDEEDDEADADRERVEEETGLTIVPVENLNAIFVQYDNLEDLREVEFWVETLDIPTLQVSIEVKFVEVVTNKAKQLKPDFTIGDLTEQIEFSPSILGARFAQNRDEFDTSFEPTVEDFGSANLLKGATVLSYIVNNGASPISFTLRVLEAQGIINVVNGPTVTVLNRESADFQIERTFGTARPVEGATGDDAEFSAVPGITPVDLSVTPTVTQAGNITLDIDVDMVDYDQNVGAYNQLTQEIPGSTATVGQHTYQNTNDFGQLRKQLTTVARIRDGGTVVLGGWRSERTEDLESGIPILRDIPFIGKFLFQRTQQREDKITLLIFLTGQVVRD